MPVITKKDEKIKVVSKSLLEGYSTNDFITKFKELYPKDWDKIVKNYRSHEEKTKLGKSHPMPKPEKYLENALKVWLKY